MGRRRTVHWAIGISIALVVGSAGVALALGAAREPPIDRVGSFQSISTELSLRGTHPTVHATVGTAIPNVEPHPATSASFHSAGGTSGPTGELARRSSRDDHEHETPHDSRDD